MTQSPKVSIILGLYNVSSFLKKKRLSCLLSQTYSNLEIILVNDGSTDDTFDLCRSLASEDDRIVLLSKPNGGLGSARNMGLDAASGEYVWFYDVDDDAELDLVEKNVSWMLKYQVDLIVFGYWCITPSQNLIQEVYFNDRLISDNQQLKSIFVDELLLVPNGNGFVWNKFYRRSFIESNHLRFGNQRIQQDEVFNLCIYPIIDKVYISRDLLYHYFVYNSGNTRSYFIPNRINIYLSIYQHFKEFVDSWKIGDTRVIDYAMERLYGGIESTLLFNLFHPDAPKSVKDKKNTFLSVLNLGDVKDCLEYIKNNKKYSIERALYLNCFLSDSFYLMALLHYSFSFMRMIKRSVF